MANHVLVTRFLHICRPGKHIKHLAPISYSLTIGFQRSHPEIGDVRGLGLMIGVDYRDGEGKPSKKLAKAVTKKAFEKGLMLLTCGPWDNTIRLIPPINISSTEVEEALGIIEDSL